MIAKGRPNKFVIPSKKAKQNQGNSSSITKISLLSLFVILPLGVVSKNCIFE